MSRFLSEEAAALAPYTPGEQPRGMRFNKLNTNESPFPPSPRVLEALRAGEGERLNLYPDPSCLALREAAAQRYGLRPEQVICGNGSDELLAFAFRAFAGAGRGIAFADITYGFYKSWARLFGLESTVVPLREDFSLAVDDYLDFNGTVVIANPNAPTGIALPLSEIERLVSAERGRVVIVDEAYVDFGGESSVGLIEKYDNLLVVQTFSKSRSLAGARLSFAMGSEALINGLNRVKYSFNPYNLDRLAIAAGCAALEDEAYFRSCTQEIVQTRAWTAQSLAALGFSVLPSRANFIFAASERIDGLALYRKLRERGILVRHFDTPARISRYCRISIGSRQQMRELIGAIEKILEE